MLRLVPRLHLSRRRSGASDRGRKKYGSQRSSVLNNLQSCQRFSAIMDTASSFSAERQKSQFMSMFVESAEKYAKFWLDPILLAESHGFLSKQLKEIRELIENHEQQIRNKWDEHVTTHRQSQN